MTDPGSGAAPDRTPVGAPAGPVPVSSAGSVGSAGSAGSVAGGGFALRRVHHVQLAIPRGAEERARPFYADALGLTEIPKPPVLAARGGAWFGRGDLQIHLGVEDPFVPARKAHPALEVDGIDALAARITAAGFPIRSDDDLPGHRHIYTDDPFGNRLEFVEPVVATPPA